MSLSVRAIALVTVLTAAACAATANGAPSRRAASSPVATHTAPATAAKPRPSDRLGFVDDVAPPRLVTTGNDFRAILRSLLEYSNWIVEHDVDASLVADVAAPGSPWETGLRRTIDKLQRFGLHFDEQYRGLSTLTLVSTLPDVVSARYTQPIIRQRLLDARGTVRAEQPKASPITTYVAVMVRLHSGEWRLASVDER